MKETILNKSLQMFINHGFKSITMDDIAKELAISKKTIYIHFASKNELVKSTVDYVFDSASERMKKIIGSCETPIHEHFVIKNCFADMFGHNIQPSAIFQFNKYYPKLSERIQKKRHEDFDSTVLRNLREGVRLGYYRSDIDIELIGRIFFVSSSAFFSHEMFEDFQNKISVEELNFKFLEYHLRGIVTSKGLEVLEQLLKK